MGREDDDIFGPETRSEDGRIVLAGRYRVLGELGRGAMGTVYLAEDETLDRMKVAVKMPAAVLSGNPRAVKHLKAEARLAMRLSHPHIVTLRTFVESSEGVFVVMDYVDGQTLDDLLIERGRLPEEAVQGLLTPVAKALDYAHAQGVIHRDVKPGNILIAKDGTPRITDFGIARELKDSFTRVTGKASSGTLPYMSPEQLMGEKPARAQDIYSLAATIYECLSGDPPFCRGQIEYQIVNQAPKPPAEEETPFVRAVLAGLAKKPEDRPPTARGLLCASSPLRKEPSLVRAPGRVPAVPFSDEARGAFERLLASSNWCAAEPPVNPQGHPEAVHSPTGLTFVLAPGGSFRMGSDGGGPNEGPAHTVRAPTFLVCKTACTQRAWERSGGENTSHFEGADHPVELVTWKDCREWCARNDLRLPSEAEWEYACRAGSTGKWCFGDDESLLAEYAEYSGNNNQSTKPVAGKKPNGWGLHDMHGNVWEWCEDAWHGDYKGAPDNGSAWTNGGSSLQVARGGSWRNLARICRSAVRSRFPPDTRFRSLGFRPAADLP